MLYCIFAFYFLRSPGVDGKGMYELKKELLSEVHQYFIHYTRNERAKVRYLSCFGEIVYFPNGVL